MISVINRVGANAWYWSSMAILGWSMLAIALYYQYVLDYLPCVLCIHVRIWVLAFVVVALFTLWVRRHWWLRLLSHTLTLGIMIGLLERSWVLLGTERGTIIGNCDFDSGLPSWFALDRWFPKVFEIQEACGYTPELLFGITMAEGLIVYSGAMLIASIAFIVATLLRKNEAH